jgi:hypothetical protein
MKLWTWHKPDFSMLDGHVDHKKSEYFQTIKGYQGACQELAGRVGTSQYIWCNTIQGQLWCNTIQGQHGLLPHHTKVEWVLDVPRDSILRFVDDIVWNRILDMRCALPNQVRLGWRNEAISRFPNDYDREARDRFEKQRKDSFWAQPPPGGSWWNALFTRPQARQGVSALVPHPIVEEWVLINPTSKR